MAIKKKSFFLYWAHEPAATPCDLHVPQWQWHVSQEQVSALTGLVLSFIQVLLKYSQWSRHDVVAAVLSLWLTRNAISDSDSTLAYHIVWLMK